MREAGMEAGLGLLRLSIGLEHAGDLIADLQRALASAWDMGDSRLDRIEHMCYAGHEAAAAGLDP